MNKKIIKISAVCTSALFLLAACSQTQSASQPTSETVAQTASAQTQTTSQTQVVQTVTDYTFFEYPDIALNSPSTQNATTISLANSQSTVSGNGAIINGDVVTINSSGVYIISGTLSNGQLIIDASKDDTIQIVLNGVNITCETSAAIWAKGGVVVLSLASGTQNTFTDGGSYYDSTSTADIPASAIYSKDSLYINGEGTLTVNANSNDGIASKDILAITSGNVNVTSVSDALRGNDGVAVWGGTINITSGKDGIKATNETDATKGFVQLDGGTIAINATGDGVQAVTAAAILGQSVNLTINAQEKGIKSDASIFIENGNITVTSVDDSVHSVDCNISGGVLTLSTSDDGVHADNTLNVSGGEITVNQSYEGLEATTINISGGTHFITASDDGINAAGGADGDASPTDRFSASKGELNISGGTVRVNAGGDGLDANGNFTMTGGIALVDGPTNGGNGPIDYDGTFNISGGTLIAVGSSQMAQMPSSSSQQASLMVTYTQTQNAQTPIQLCNANGEVLFTYYPSKTYNSVVISSEDLSVNSSYTLCSNGSATVNATGFTTGGTKGTEIVTTTLSAITTSIRDDGTQAATGGMGAMGAMGGAGGGRGGMGTATKP